MQGRNFLAQASTLALSTGWLSACGGGGSTDTGTGGTSTGTPTNPVVSTPPGTTAKSRVIVVGGGMGGATVTKLAVVEEISKGKVVALVPAALSGR
jgi:hypothetical protein